MSKHNLPLTVRFNLDMVFIRVDTLTEFNISNGAGKLVPALGKDYFVLNLNGQLLRHTLHAETDRIKLKQYMEDKRLFILEYMQSVDVNPDKMILCCWDDPDENNEKKL